MGLYDRDYMKERGKKQPQFRYDENRKLILIAVISFILGFIAGKII
jgi:hypothetical protein